jgi:secreted trypsin-like serine protease
MMNFTQYILISLFFTLLSAPTWAIVNGTVLDKDNDVRNFIVNIKLKNGMCTGTVISPTVVLTAAHCADLMGTPELVAQITGEPTIKCNISTVIESSLAPSAQQDLPLKVHSPDILLLKLETPLCSVRIAPLSFNTPKVNDVLHAAGYGEGSFPFGKAHSFSFTVIDNKTISTHVTPQNHWDDDLLVLAPRTYLFGLPNTTGASVCGGDSGGPVYIIKDGASTLIGVSGAALPNINLGASCEKKYLQLFTPLSPYKEWIESKLKEWAPAP